LMPNKLAIGNWQLAMFLAERVGFEPTERFPVHSISSAANSTTLAPLPRNCRFPIANCRLNYLTDPTQQKSAIGNRQFSWRRGWDLNPRWSFPHSGFRDRCTKPLCDLSKNKAEGGRMKDEQELANQKGRETYKPTL